MKRLIAILLLIVPFKLTGQSDDSYHLYSLIIKEFYGKNNKILIQEVTTIESNITDSKFEYYKSLFNEFKRETVDSFIKNNQIPDTLVKERFVLDMEIQILPKKDIDALFSTGGGGWDSFYEKYGETQGILTFSKVGFDKSKTQAFIYFGYQSDWLAGAGFYVFLSKKNGVWIIEGQVMAWIS